MSDSPVTTPVLSRGSGRLEGKRVVVTGGARGIGGEIARRFAAEGADVAILDLLTDRGAELSDSIGGTFHPVDLGDTAQTVAAMEAALGALGGVDVLVNSAGILRFAPLLDVGVDDWDTLFAVNTRAMLTTMQAAARAMIAAGAAAGADGGQDRGGSIINLASMAAKTGGAGEGAYAASKAAVVALTRVAALEWGEHGIRVNCLCPGYVLTEMGAATRTDEMVASWSAMSPLGRCASPADVAGVALFLASPDAGYLTGQAVNVTGGMLMS
ncbi:SDR family NAD(P)-dependent oxidoreductase [Frondihabitans peucedani]|uniref:3-oxoacyl-[acyl-carrier-protein] reductase n=1 Tax=Frondihabitans peucedani TaxID=598626 RepID=A0ABP8E5L2_9MICO